MTTDSQRQGVCHLSQQTTGTITLTCIEKRHNTHSSRRISQYNSQHTVTAIIYSVFGLERENLRAVSGERYRKMSLAYRSSSSLNSHISRTRYMSRHSSMILSTCGSSRNIMVMYWPVLDSRSKRPIKRMNDK